MLTITALYDHIDALVLDYVERRPTAFRRSNLFKKNSNAKYVVKAGLKLEEIYFYYLRGNGLPSISANENYLETEPESGTHKNLPNLPREVIDQILKHCSTKSMLNFRLLSRSLNVLSSEHLQEKRRENCVNLNTTVNIDRFLFAFRKGLPGLGNPLSTYNLYYQVSGTLGVLDLVGCHMKFVTLCDTDNILEVLEKMPNVKRLCTWKSPSLPGDNGLKGPQHFSLQTLIIRDSSFNLGEFTAASYISRWLQIAPNLSEFEARVVDRIDSPLELFDLICSNKQLRKITLYDICLRMDSCGNIHISLEDVSLYSGASQRFVEFIALSSSFIKSLGIRHEFNVPLPILPNLTSLKLRIDSNIWSSASCKLPEMFPALQHLTLVDPMRHMFFQSYRSTVFHTVESLSVSGCWWWDKDDIPIFHTIFPRVKSLSLGGCPSQQYVDYFSNNFQDITCLNFYNFDSTLDILDESTLGGKVGSGMQSPFSSLKSVRNMRFEPKLSVRGIVMDLLNLTLKELLPPLDNLTVRFKPQPDYGEEADHVTQVNNVEDLLDSMKQLRYHKNMNFQYIPRND